MSPQNGYCAKRIQLIQSVWTESRVNTLYWNIVYWRDFLSITTGSAVYIWRNILVFHFTCSSISNSFTYGGGVVVSCLCASLMDDSFSNWVHLSYTPPLITVGMGERERDSLVRFSTQATSML